MGQFFKEYVRLIEIIEHRVNNKFAHTIVTKMVRNWC